MMPKFSLIAIPAGGIGFVVFIFIFLKNKKSFFRGRK